VAGYQNRLSSSGGADVMTAVVIALVLPMLDLIVLVAGKVGAL
jgi:hypothetical protein